MTCFSCRHSAHSPIGLFCLLLLRPAEFRCEAFTYEPGTDERETQQCNACREFFAQYRCAAQTHGECDCPVCQGYCRCKPEWSRND